jgi:predicted TIM-barrel enzyme
VVTSTLVDAILIAGPMAGAVPNLSLIREAKDAVGDSVPVLLNTGATAERVPEYLSVADGVIVGSFLKVDGHTWNPVDPHRVKQFMSAVHAVRASRHVRETA